MMTHEEIEAAKAEIRQLKREIRSWAEINGFLPDSLINMLRSKAERIAELEQQLRNARA